jgi:hypothetical protein
MEKIAMSSIATARAAARSVALIPSKLTGPE